jgi:1,4-alpha-glucan branching enzyme
MWAHPGKKLLFMGGEFGQRREWAHEEGLEWWVLQYGDHSGLMNWVADLNRAYTTEPALHEVDFDPSGFEWIDANSAHDSTLSFIRKTRDGRNTVLVVCNLTPVPRENYLVGVPHDGYWREIINSDAAYYGGSGMGNEGGAHAHPVSAHGRYHAIRITLPPLSTVFFRHER